MTDDKKNNETVEKGESGSSEEQNQALQKELLKEQKTLPENRAVPEKRKRRSKKQFSFPLFLCFIGMFAALGIGGWVFYEQYQSKLLINSMEDRLKSGESKIALLESLLPGVKALNDSVEKLAQADVRNQQLVDEKLEETLEAIDKRLGVTSEDWIMAEVEYLLRLASQRISLDDDIISAVKLLKTADKILQQTEIVTAFEVRQAIANDILSLEKLNTVDRQGLFAQLTAVHSMIKALQQKKYEFDVAEGDKASGQATGPLTWRDRLAVAGTKIWSSVSRLIDFRRNDTPVKPLMPPEEEYYLRHNLQLKIELARLAMLRGDQQIFDQSLIEASVWVKLHFDKDDNLTQVFLENIEQLSGDSVVTEAGDIGESVLAVRNYMSRFKNDTKIDTKGED